MDKAAIEGGLGISALIASAGPVVKLILFILFVLSVVSWAIILFKWLRLKRAKDESTSFIEIF